MAIFYIPDVQAPETPVPQTPRGRDLGESSKFLMRRAKIQELERLQDLEDKQDIKMTSEQYELLAETFVEVKAEFGDLDGMSWERPDAQAMLRQWVRRGTSCEFAVADLSIETPAGSPYLQVQEDGQGCMPDDALVGQRGHRTPPSPCPYGAQPCEHPVSVHHSGR